MVRKIAFSPLLAFNFVQDSIGARYPRQTRLYRRDKLELQPAADQMPQLERLGIITT
jgi:hypothetical protein